MNKDFLALGLSIGGLVLSAGMRSDAQKLEAADPTAAAAKRRTAGIVAAAGFGGSLYILMPALLKAIK